MRAIHSRLLVLEARDSIGIDCGGLHFAGREILYDTATLKQVDSVDEATVPVKERPDWSYSSPDFSGD